METVGLGDCNGWLCKCGHEEVDIASFKLFNGDYLDKANVAGTTANRSQLAIETASVRRDVGRN